MRNLWVPAMVLLGLSVSAGLLQGREIKRDFHRRFEAKEGTTLHLKYGDGDVTVTPWAKDEVDIEVRYHADCRGFGLGGGKRGFTVEFDQRGDDIYVTGEERSYRIVIGFSVRRVYEHTYTVRAPEYVELDLSGDDGDVSITGWKADISCRLDDGDLELRDIRAERTRIRVADGDVSVLGFTGDVSLSGEDGDVELRDCLIGECRIRLDDGDLSIRKSSGDFDIGVADGRVSLDRIRAGTFQLRMEDGDADIYLLKGEELDADITADDGDVLVELEPGMAVSFFIDTDDGRIRLDLPGGESFRQGRHVASGEFLGGGDGRIRIRTEDGRVILRGSE